MGTTHSSCNLRSWRPRVIDLSRHVFEALRKDDEFILYRGRNEEEISQVLVLVPATEEPGSKSLKRLEHEYSLKEDLEPALSARPIEVTFHWDRPVLVLEDPGGICLDQLLGRASDLGSSLRRAISLATAIGNLHRRGLVHKDVKPANILVDPGTGNAWLMGFGIASRLPRERQSPDAPEFIAGTLAYMAPEQTGRMNRSTDSRSDLYSYGVTLYEMLTGCLPFAASDAMEWVHCHVARRPVPPDQRNRGIPSTVSSVVMKLLAKTAEERYQTAVGVESDLKRCLAEWVRLGRVDPFSLGKNDASDSLWIPERLYGRDQEVKVLLDAFERVVTGEISRLALVSGYSGIGKSSVVNEATASPLRWRLFASSVSHFRSRTRKFRWLLLLSWQTFRSTCEAVPLANWSNHRWRTTRPCRQLLPSLSRRYPAPTSDGRSSFR